ncbi:Gfo/Idh/MocA family protein [Falsirhodobacter sp. 20TX0035]|uniref:Gfo/Idh/MocA family protein n=1 Tax=Falsirhodobacter sp. 20TX0035 TaxID=3022019 RepID=UPI00232CF999|nr:Gfo/Idh/MocA family oxidoreductase [Falsirhodobacter sp. 20TX0035]MDB6453732.1 Gfo/Idh/MocA family oxidoreductase [Falsirhodobacter sp. 20TX0035]
MTIRLALVGLGKIARDQHLPAIEATEGLRLTAIASRHAGHPDLPSYPEIDALLAAEDAEAVTLCTPPQGRHAQARAAIAAGRHVMLEKPPGATVTEVQDLARQAKAAGVTLFATWHSREAAAVDAARDWLATRPIRHVRITWKEDVRHWHPRQEWIWQAGGLGVFDPGINALSIATAILPAPLFVTAADLSFPSNRAAPIAARIAMDCGGAPVDAEFDWRQTGPQTWDIEVETESGTLRLSHGGSRLHLDGAEQMAAPDREYARLYARFADLIRTGRSDVDLSPLQLVADAFLLAERHQVEAFEE